MSSWIPTPSQDPFGTSRRRTWSSWTRRASPCPSDTCQRHTMCTGKPLGRFHRAPRCSSGRPGRISGRSDCGMSPTGTDHTPRSPARAHTPPLGMQYTQSRIHLHTSRSGTLCTLHPFPPQKRSQARSRCCSRSSCTAGSSRWRMAFLYHMKSSSPTAGSQCRQRRN